MEMEDKFEGRQLYPVSRGLVREEPWGPRIGPGKLFRMHPLHVPRDVLPVPYIPIDFKSAEALAYGIKYVQEVILKIREIGDRLRDELRDLEVLLFLRIGLYLKVKAGHSELAGLED